MGYLIDNAFPEKINFHRLPKRTIEDSLLPYDINQLSENINYLYEKVELLANMAVKSVNCVNCGAPLENWRCVHCGTNYKQLLEA